MVALLEQDQLGSPWASVSACARWVGCGAVRSQTPSSPGIERDWCGVGRQVLMILLRLNPVEACGVRARFWQTGGEPQEPSSLWSPLLGSCQHVESIKRKDEENMPVLCRTVVSNARELLSWKGGRLSPDRMP